MNLKDIFIPNKFGTLPIIDIVGIGNLSLTDAGFFKLMLIGDDTKYLKAEEVEDVITLSERVNGKIFAYTKGIEYYADIRYLKQATSDEMLIANALGENYNLFYEYDGVLDMVLPRHKHTLMTNGTGWIHVGEPDALPCNFYIEDLLYRLDLQGKLT